MPRTAINSMIKVPLAIEQVEEARWIAYPRGVKGGIAGQGETMEAAIDDFASAFIAHVDAFGVDVVAELLPEDIRQLLREKPEEFPNLFFVTCPDSHVMRPSPV